MFCGHTVTSSLIIANSIVHSTPGTCDTFCQVLRYINTAFSLAIILLMSLSTVRLVLLARSRYNYIYRQRGANFILTSLLIVLATVTAFCYNWNVL